MALALALGWSGNAGVGGASSTEDMVWIPAGPAVLGGIGHSSMPGPARFDPPGYWIDRFEVTNARYLKFIKATGHQPPAFHDDPAFNRPDQPVTGVTWDDANAFCHWAGGRLPNEIEWEKAARGVDRRLYPWGNEPDLSRAGLTGEIPLPVTATPGDVSPYGVRGMAGNVSEWVEDLRLAGNSCRRVHAGNGPARALQLRAYLRGNSFSGLPHMTKVHHRLWDYTDTVSEFFGFRCVRPGPSKRTTTARTG
ncbi:MAG: formylglycine-generating enzyme family protein [Methyloligellaceae bacterium]